MDPYEYTLDELMAGIEDAAPEQPADGFLTAQEWARVWGVHVGKARDHITALLENGRMVRQERSEMSLLSQRIIRKSVFGIVQPEEKK